jgi:putative tryptophan/tyrosine transport system substrate-binding protein
VRRREFITLLGGAAVAWPLATHAQQPDRVRRIGILEMTSAALNSASYGAFLEAMKALGYIEGRNIVIEYRSAEGFGERFPELAADLLRLKVDVIVTRGTPAILAAKAATTSVPIVMAAAGEPLMVVASLARPGSNVTGLSGYSTDLEAKRVEVLKEMIPNAKRIAGLYNMGNPVVPPQWNELQKAAQTLGVQSELLDIRKTEDIGPAFEIASRHSIDAIQVGVDTLTLQNRKLIADFAGQHRLPTIYVSREYVEAGGLIAYGPSYPDLYRRAASYVDKIFKGEKPGDLPIEQPTKFELVINLKTAKALGLTVPPSLLARADELFE